MENRLPGLSRQPHLYIAVPEATVSAKRCSNTTDDEFAITCKKVVTRLTWFSH